MQVPRPRDLDSQCGVSYSAPSEPTAFVCCKRIKPPGQAKKWQRGRLLPSDVVYHDLPRELSVCLRVPPYHHRYVQIAGDIPIVVIGTCGG